MPKLGNISNERQLLIYEFMEALNAQRGDKYKPLKPGFVNSKMAHLKTFELKMFLADCKRAKHFSKYWWWALKPQDK